MDSIQPVELDPGQSPSFGELLRRHRIAAGLTQEALADRAGLSANAVSTLERGARHAPHKETIALLATALRLSDDQRAALGVAARRGPRAVPGAARPLPAHRETPSPPPDPLPAEVVPLLEREREEAEVVALLRRPDVRLLTLTGPGGVGKTSLALRAARSARADFADSAAFVALAEVVTPDHVAAAIALALALRDLGGRPLPEALRDHLRDKQLLLVLDNFEHVADAAPLVAALRQDCPRLTLLVTSRHALRLRGEYCFDVLPLAAPRAADAPDVAALARYAAVRLFLHYARAAVPDFELTAANAAAVADVCARPDGLPLAIELAAARLPVLAPADLSARLARRLDLLADGPLDAPRRHRTMRASIAWSYELLAPAEQTVFLCLCVCVGGGTLAAVEAIAAALDAQGTGVAEVDVLAALGALARKSLVRREGRDAGAPRFAVLHTVREYGLERAAASGALAPLRRGHAAYVLALAETTAAALRGPGQAAALAHLEAEADNLRAALSWALEDGDTTTALRLGGALWPAWYARGYLSEGRVWLERVLAAAEASGGDVALLPRARVLDGAGLLAYSQGDYAIATAHCDRALALYREAGDTAGMAAVLNNLGHVARATGDHPHARSLYEHSLELRRGLRDARGMAASLNNLALVAGERDRYGRAEALYHESLGLKRELGDTEGIAVTLNNLGLAARAQGTDRACPRPARGKRAPVPRGGERAGRPLCPGQPGGGGARRG